MTREQSNLIAAREKKLVAVIAIALSLLTLFLIWGPVTEAFAATGHGDQLEGHLEGHAPTIGDLKLYWLNFLLFLALMWFVTRKGVPQAWNARRLAIRDAAERGKRAALQAQAEVDAATQAMATVNQEMEQVARTIAQDGDAEARRIMEDARATAQQIERQIAGTIAAEQRALQHAVRQEMAATVMHKVEERIGRELSPEVDAKLRAVAVSSARALREAR